MTKLILKAAIFALLCPLLAHSTTPVQTCGGPGDPLGPTDILGRATEVKWGLIQKIFGNPTSTADTGSAAADKSVEIFVAAHPEFTGTLSHQWKGSGTDPQYNRVFSGVSVLKNAVHILGRMRVVIDGSGWRVEDTVFGGEIVEVGYYKEGLDRGEPEYLILQNPVGFGWIAGKKTESVSFQENGLVRIYLNHVDSARFTERIPELPASVKAALERIQEVAEVYKHTANLSKQQQVENALKAGVSSVTAINELVSDSGYQFVAIDAKSFKTGAITLQDVQNNFVVVIRGDRISGSVKISKGQVKLIRRTFEFSESDPDNRGPLVGLTVYFENGNGKGHRIGRGADTSFSDGHVFLLQKSQATEK